MVLDGGLATSLEALGCDLNDPLWSARVLLEEPELIRRVHLDFLRAGADCIATASYQATVQGFCRRGLDESDARALITLSARLALDARDAFWGTRAATEDRLRPLVAGSIGPYGAFLADGSEYTGRYGLNREELHAFHADRWRILAGTGVDLLACETIPSGTEVDVLLQLLEEEPKVWAWISFSCPDGRTLADGTPVEDVASACDSCEGVAAVGLNCLGPGLVSGLLGRLRSVTEKPILVYPNSGERYLAGDRTWAEEPEGIDWGREARRWRSQGADGVGGCCRVGSPVIRAIRDSLLGS